jgi:uncharacterized protein HemY
LAGRAVEQAPEERAFWNTLGVAHYRAGDPKAAIEALERSRGLSQGGDSFDFFFLALAHARLGQTDRARHWYDEAVDWMDRHRPDDEQLCRFRAEAAELLGRIEQKP